MVFQRRMWCQKRALELRSLRGEFVGLRSMRTAGAKHGGMEVAQDGDSRWLHRSRI